MLSTQYLVLSTLHVSVAITLLFRLVSSAHLCPVHHRPPPLGSPAASQRAGASSADRSGEILERFDIGKSQLESFVSGEPLSPGEDDVLVKILYRLPRLGLDNLERWRQRGVSWDQLAAAPAEQRANVFHLSGRVQRVERQKLLPEQAELYEFNDYFRVTLCWKLSLPRFDCRPPRSGRLADRWAAARRTG